MALHHSQSGEIARLQTLSDPATATQALARTPSFEAIHLVVRAGQSIPPHRVAGSLTLYCVAGHARISGATTVELQAGDWLYLEPGAPHAVDGLADTSLLLTIMFNDSRLFGDSEQASEGAAGPEHVVLNHIGGSNG